MMLSFAVDDHETRYAENFGGKTCEYYNLLITKWKNLNINQQKGFQGRKIYC